MAKYAELLLTLMGLEPQRRFTTCVTLNTPLFPEALVRLEDLEAAVKHGWDPSN